MERYRLSLMTDQAKCCECDEPAVLQHAITKRHFCAKHLDPRGKEALIGDRTKIKITELVKRDVGAGGSPQRMFEFCDYCGYGKVVGRPCHCHKSRRRGF